MKEELEQIVRRFGDQRILVLGDFLLDEYLFGEISRVSREAPVLILKYQETRWAPGGAANTVANAASLGATVWPVGFLGDDPGATEVIRCWPEGVQADHVFRESRFTTTRKTRILAGSFHSFRQQVVRLDYEHRLTLNRDDENRIEQSLESLIPDSSGIILSDYALGNVTRNLRLKAIALARRYRVPLLVDSRDDPGGYPGATSITPNITEIESALGKRFGLDTAFLEEQCFELLETWQLDSLLVTRGRLGMALFVPGRCLHIPIYGSDEVVDVTGAGDTVIATYTTALAAGGSFEQAARLANLAGGIVVMKKGTATVNALELLDAITGLEEA